MSPRPRAFTLVELLVVITIIVVLLALLTPAMDRAIYYAELAVCAARLDANGAGMISGAAANQRRYPERLAHMAPFNVNIPSTLTGLVGGDDRPGLRAYLGLDLNKVLNDPLTTPVDLDGSKPTTWVQTSYALWYGWELASQPSMRRLGDSWTWDGYRFNVLAQDFEVNNWSGAFRLSSHPDRSGILVPFVRQDAGGLQQEALNGGGETTSTWLTSSAVIGLLDWNVLYTDGSVIRYGDVQPYDADERVVSVPRAWQGSDASVKWIRVPKS